MGKFGHVSNNLMENGKIWTGGEKNYGKWENLDRWQKM